MQGKDEFGVAPLRGKTDRANQAIQQGVYPVGVKELQHWGSAVSDELVQRRVQRLPVGGVLDGGVRAFPPPDDRGRQQVAHGGAQEAFSRRSKVLNDQGVLNTYCTSR
jgi:hypothetical protein